MSKIVEILGKSYRLTEGPSAPGNGDMGRQRTMDQVIWINAQMCQEAKDATLIHECLHAVSDHLGLELSEKQILGLETALYSMGFVVNVVQTGESP